MRRSANVDASIVALGVVLGHREKDHERLDRITEQPGRKTHRHQFTARRKRSKSLRCRGDVREWRLGGIVDLEHLNEDGEEVLLVVDDVGQQGVAGHHREGLLAHPVHPEHLGANRVSKG